MIHFGSDIYACVENGEYEKGKKMIYKMCEYARRGIMEDMKRDRKGDRKGDK